MDERYKKELAESYKDFIDGLDEDYMMYVKGNYTLDEFMQELDHTYQLFKDALKSGFFQ